MQLRLQYFETIINIAFFSKFLEILNHSRNRPDFYNYELLEKSVSKLKSQP